jgi:hypothetical protein
MDDTIILENNDLNKNIDKFGNTIDESIISPEEIEEEENIEDDIDEIDEDTLLLLHKLRMKKQDINTNIEISPNKPKVININDKKKKEKKSITLQEFTKMIPDEEMKTSKFISSRVESKRKQNNNIVKRHFNPRKPPFVFIRNNNITFINNVSDFPDLGF